MAIYGVIGAMSDMFVNHVDPEVAFQKLTVTDGEDVFSWNNPEWVEAGVVTPGSKGGSLTTRNSFQSRRAAIRVLQELMDVAPDRPEEK